MLRLRTVPVLPIAAAAVILGGAVPASADAPSDVTCPPGLLDCVVDAEDEEDEEQGEAPPGESPQQGGAGDPDDEEQRCFSDIAGDPNEVDCYLDGVGWWSAQYECYLQPASPPIAADDPRWIRGTWLGEPSEEPDGAAYESYCLADSGREYMWLPGPPDGAPEPEVDVEALAQRAVEQMGLRGPDIGIVPDPDSEGGAVGVPVWMWNTGQAPGSVGPITESATAGAVTVTGEATIEQVVWEMGDGTSVTCTSHGTPYDASHGMAESPDCGHVYRESSADQPGSQYAVVATTTWQVEWEGGGESGVITTTRTSSVQITIGELSVVN